MFSTKVSRFSTRPSCSAFRFSTKPSCSARSPTRRRLLARASPLLNASAAITDCFSPQETASLLVNAVNPSDGGSSLFAPTALAFIRPPRTTGTTIYKITYYVVRLDGVRTRESTETKAPARRLRRQRTRPPVEVGTVRRCAAVPIEDPKSIAAAVRALVGAFDCGSTGAALSTTPAPCCAMLQQPTSCVITSPLPARELSVAERIADGRGRHARAPRAVAVSMLITTAQRVEDVRRQKLLWHHRPSRRVSAGPWRASSCSDATAMLRGTLAHGCRGARGPRLYGRGVPWVRTLYINFSQRPKIRGT